MNNQAWECPRCGCINAPFKLVCFCKPSESSSCMKRPISDNYDAILVNELCRNCVGRHGIWEGRAIQCVNLHVTP